MNSKQLPKPKLRVDLGDNTIQNIVVVLLFVGLFIGLSTIF